jgi:hypothetical protein
LARQFLITSIRLTSLSVTIQLLAILLGRVHSILPGQQQCLWLHRCSDRWREHELDLQLSESADGPISPVRMSIWSFVLIMSARTWLSEWNAWRLGQSSADWEWVDPYLQVEPNIWTHAFYLPTFTNVYAGDWEMKIYADTGHGFFQLTTFHFIVPGGNQQWPGSPYQYNGNSYTLQWWRNWRRKYELDLHL